VTAAPSVPTASRRAARRGISLVEVMIALVILSGVVLAMGMSTTNFSRKVTDSDVRNRAQSVAEMQVGRARAWPTYSTLSQLATTRYNGSVDGLISATTVATDTTGGINITKVSVTVSAVQSTLLPTPITRTITIAAP
jgi:prepilin-type N-terminal cleavage/methylation domain-containing protein